MDSNLSNMDNEAMSTEQVLLRLPEALVVRFKQAVPARSRSDYVRQLLEQALPAADGDNDPLYLAALAVEQDAALGAEMADWDAATAGDGLVEEPSAGRHA